MNKKFVGIVLLVVALAVIFALTTRKSPPVVEQPVTDKSDEEQARVYHPRRVSFVFTVRNTSAQPLRNVEVIVRGPNKNTTFQVCDKLESDYSFEVTTDAVNNQLVHYVFDVFPPFATKVIRLNAQLSMTASPGLARLADKEQYLGEEPLLEISNKELIAGAAVPADTEELKKLSILYERVAGFLQKTSYTGRDRGALRAFRDKRGDCTEFMRLFVAYCRINNIPARGVSGYIAKRDKVIVANEFHNWAEVYTGNSWRIVDPFNKIFMENEDEYVATRIHGGQTSVVTRWRASDENLRVTMER